MNQNNEWHYEMPEFAKEAFRKRDAKEARHKRVLKLQKFIIITTAVLTISVVGIRFLTSNQKEVERSNLDIDILSSDFIVQGKTVINPNDESSRRTLYQITDKTGDKFVYCVETGSIKKVNNWF